MSRRAFQDQGAVRYCYGCGADNEKGLQLKSYWDGEESVAVWQAQPHHCGGSRGIVNGGIIASLMDCHGLNLAVAHAYRSEQRDIGTPPRIGYVTGHLEVSYFRPAPIHEPLHLRAGIARVEGRKAWVRCTLSAAGQVCATAEILGIRVERD